MALALAALSVGGCAPGDGGEPSGPVVSVTLPVPGTDGPTTSLVPPGGEGPGTPAGQAATAGASAGDEDGEPVEDVDIDDFTWKPTAEGFSRAFTNTSVGFDAWSAGLRPWVTDEVLASFSNPKVLDVVPSYAPLSIDVVAYGGTEMQVAVYYDSSWFAQKLTLVRDGTPGRPGWLVAGVERQQVQ